MKPEAEQNIVMVYIMVSIMPDGVDLAVSVHQLSAQVRGSCHLILEAVQLVLQGLEAGRLRITQVLLVAAHLQNTHSMYSTHSMHSMHIHALYHHAGLGDCCRLHWGRTAYAAL